MGKVKILELLCNLVSIATMLVLVHGSDQTAATMSSSSSLCNQTPYPQLCNTLITTTAASSSLNQNQMHMSFRNSALAATKKRVLEAQQLVSTMDLAPFTAQAKAAWADCVELYEDTISQLESSSSSSSSLEDSQTWLSAAIANQQTCQNGFLDLKLSSLEYLPFNSSDNISQHLSNLLAINKYIQDATTAAAASLPPTTQNPKSIGNRRLLNTKTRLVDSDNFPTWVSPVDRKLLQSEGSTINANVVVAQDGSGNYKTISEAVTASKSLRSGSTTRFVIHVKAGVYNENVVIPKSMPNIMMIGDGISATVVTGSKNVIDGSTTYASATFAVSGPGFIAKGMTFQNTAGPQKHQAVSFRSASDLSVYYSCSFEGYQDTLYAYTQRQFYRNCNIYGTVDFIFGDAVAVFQNCNIYVRKPLANQQNTVTAQGRKDPNENTGISILNSVVAAAPDLLPVQGSFETFLGRPWQMYSRTVFMETSLGSLINPAGWLPWDGNFALSTLYYGEYMNTGAGAATSARINWPGFHVITSATQAAAFTVANFLSGASWIPATGVPYTLGL